MVDAVLPDILGRIYSKIKARGGVSLCLAVM
jgi:hypothetical protein